MDPDAAGRALLGISPDTGQLPQLPQNAVKAEYISMINRLVDAHNQELIAKIYSDSETRRMIIGYQKDGWGSGKDFGLKLSVEGVDVLTADDADLLFKLAY